jgi:hypothetical protein
MTLLLCVKTLEEFRAWSLDARASCYFVYKYALNVFVLVSVFVPFAE